MKRLMTLLLTAALAAHCVTGAHADDTSATVTGTRLLALCYHDVVEDPQLAARDPMSVTLDNLVKQFAWLDAQGFEPITLDQWAAAADGGPLPDKPVLLTFDDGYASFGEHVLPLLKLFGFPAVLAPVTNWIDAPPGAMVDYGGERVPRSRFLTWSQLRDIAASGQVEIASHSHDLHRGVAGNPFNNQQPAAVTRVWDPDTRSYETAETYEARLESDLRRSVSLITEHLGEPPRTIVWPYGAYNAQSTLLARALGLRYSLTLDGTPNAPGLQSVHRLLVGSDTSMLEFAMTAHGLYPPRPLRAVQVDMDYLYDPDPEQTERNLDRLLDRIKAMQLSAVFLQAFADPDGDGAADALYFPNRHLPMRADLFNRVAWQLKTRADVKVFAWMPVLAYQLPDASLNETLAVKAKDEEASNQYHRLSPFHPDARRVIREIYADLGRSSQFAGVLFHDDAFLTDREDVNPAALTHYRDVWLTDEASGQIPDPAPLAAMKTQHLIDWTQTLADELRFYQPALVTARNLYSRVVTEPESEAWFAQNFRKFQASYDYTAIMAMPFLEQAKDPEAWLQALIARVEAVDGAMDRTLFELQAVDWQRQRPLPERVLAEQMDLLLDSGIRHIAYYPDDFIKGTPSLEIVRSRLSVNDFPALKE